MPVFDKEKGTMAKNVMNLVNFVRGCEPRRPKDLYTPVREEIRINRENGLKSTFLLQYDALIRPDFQELLLRERGDDMELGLWFEMCRPLTEAVGIEWRGRPGFDWDWYVDPGFLPAYTPKQREGLIDEVFRKFREVFGYYPRVAGSWILDAHSMAYMSDKYGMDAFCICREQYAVDAYTLWGGYYSGGYYPSRRNMLCPAQTREMQIDTPVFRMLGIDPIYGYDEDKHMPSIGGCYTMEPCWPCGKNRDVMEWYFRSYYTNPSLALSHATTGQENSFGWDRIEEGYRLQVEIMKQYIAEGKLCVETLGETGAAFRKKYEKTPASALSALEDWSKNGLQSVWFSCVNYRANLFYKEGKLFFRDMQCFNEQVTEPYFDSPCRQWQATYGNLPLVDNRLWSEPENEAALFLSEPVAKMEKVRELPQGELEVQIRFADDHTGAILFTPGQIIFRNCGAMQWNFGKGTILRSVGTNRMKFQSNNLTYELGVIGTTHRQENRVMIEPTEGVLSLHFVESV